jgi:hypothetical protein
MDIVETPVGTETSSQPLRARRVMTRGSRIYAAGIVAVQLALFVLPTLSPRGPSMSDVIGTPFAIIPALATVGAMLVVGNIPIGRLVYAPAAVLQVLYSALFVLAGLLGLLAAFFQQEGAAYALAFVALGGFAMIYLAVGVIVLLRGVGEETTAVSTGMAALPPSY